MREMRAATLFFALVACVHGVRLHQRASRLKAQALNNSNASAWAALQAFYNEGRWRDVIDQSVQPQQIGSGTFGIANKVSLAPLCREDAQVVVKQIKLTAEVDSKMLLNELQIQQALTGHPNIVSLYDYHPQDPRYWETEGSVYVMMPLARGGEIDKAYSKEVKAAGIKTGKIYTMNLMEKHALHWKDNRQIEADHRPRNTLLSKIALDTFAGLSYMHSNKFVHRDLKPQNVWASHENCMTEYSAECKYMLGDFGLATVERKANRDVCGTPPFFPPEIESGGHPHHFTYAYPTMRIGWSKAGDVYALGLTLLSIVSGTGAPSYSLGSQLFNIREWLRSNIVGLGEHLTELLVWTLAPEPHHRISAEDAYKLAEQAFMQVTNQRPPALAAAAVPMCVQECVRMRCCYNLRANILEGKCDDGSALSEDRVVSARAGFVVADRGRLAWVRDAPADAPIGVAPPKILPTGRYCYNQNEIPAGDRLLKGLLIPQEKIAPRGASQALRPGAQAPPTPPAPSLQILASGKLRVTWAIPQVSPAIVSITVGISISGKGTFVVDATDGKNLLVPNGGQPLRPDATYVEVDIQPGLTCQAQVSFRNVAGPSHWSPSSTSVSVPVRATKPLPSPPPPLHTAPKPTLGLVGSHCLEISWTIPQTTPSVQSIVVSLRMNNGKNFVVDTTGGQNQLVASGGQPIAAPATSVQVCVQPGYEYDALISFKGGNIQTEWSEASARVKIPKVAPSLDESPMREYALGDPVLYFSASRAEWVDAYIIKVDARGVQVDWKVGDPIPFHMLEGKIKPRDGPKYVKGDAVQYLSSTTGLWFDCEVIVVSSQGIKTNLKPDDYIQFYEMKDKIRPRAIAYSIGDRVQYYSPTNKQWIDAEITNAHETHGYEIDKKRGVYISREEARTKLKLRESVGPQYSVGDLVHYYSVTHAGWVDTTITKVDHSDGYEVDAKRGVYITFDDAKTKLKPRKVVAATPAVQYEYSVGDRVQYWSGSRQEWLDCVITKIDPEQGYETNLNKGFFLRFDEAKTRFKPGKIVAAAPAVQYEYSVGDLVHYWSGSQQKWLDCAITQIDPEKGYETDLNKGFFLGFDEAKDRFRRRHAPVRESKPNRRTSVRPQGFHVGQAVWYLSTGTGAYEPAHIVDADANGLYIDIRPGQPISPEHWDQRLKPRILVS